MRRRGGRYSAGVLDVTPVVAIDDAPHAVLAHLRIGARNVGDILPVGAPTAHFQNIGLSDLGIAALLATDHRRDVATTPARYAIPDVINLRSCVKMLRIHARRVIAIVKRKKLSKRLPELDLKGNSMGQQGPVIIGNDAIPIAVDGAGPWPAFILAKAGRHLIAKVAFHAAKWLDFANALKDNAAGAAWPRFQVHGPNHAASRLLRQGAPT